MKQAISTRWLPNRGHNHFPRNFQSSYEYLIFHQSEDSHAHQVITQVTPIMLTIIEPRNIIIF